MTSLFYLKRQISVIANSTNVCSQTRHFVTSFTTQYHDFCSLTFLGLQIGRVYPDQGEIRRRLWRTPKDNRTFGDFERTYCLIAQQNFEMSQAKFWRKSLSTMSIKTLAEDFQLGIHLEIIWMLLDFKVNSI